MDRSLTTTIVTFILGLFFIIMIASQIMVQGHSYKTEIAMRYNSGETIEFDGVVIRDEHTVTQQVEGVIRYANENGSKLAINSVMAEVYKTEEDIEKRRQIDLIKLRIEQLEDAKTLTGTDNSQIESFTKLITEKHSRIVTAIDEGDYSEISSLKYELMNLQCKKSMAKGRTINYDDVIAALNSRVEDLEKSISSQPEIIYSPESGYFVNSVDGYEGEFSYADADNITPDKIKEVVASPKKEADKDAIGKMISDYSWKVAAVIDDNASTSVEKGDKVNLVAGSDQSVIVAYVENIKSYGDDQNVIVLSSDDLNDKLSSIRTERFRLLIDSFNGIRISSSAIHFDDENNIGVFIKDGVRCSFRKIERIYTAEGYVVAADTTGKAGYLSMYDNIIVEGKDLSEGKIL